MAVYAAEHRRRLLRRRVPRRSVRPAVRPADDRTGSPHRKSPKSSSGRFPSDATPEELAEFATDLAESATADDRPDRRSEHGWAMLQAMATVFAVDPPFILVNDALRSPPSTEIVADLPEEFRDAIQGLSPTVPPVVPPEPPGAYATNSLDCLNLIALAAVEAGTDDPAAIAEEMLNVSVVGSLCNSFAAVPGHRRAGPQHQLSGSRTRSTSPSAATRRAAGSVRSPSTPRASPSPAPRQRSPRVTESD